MLLPKNSHKLKPKQNIFARIRLLQKKSSLMSCKLSHEFVQNYIESFGYQLLSRYENAKTKLTVKCDKGHVYYTVFHTLKSGRKCRTCAGLEKKTIEEAIFEFEKRGYQCLETVYVNVNTPMNFRCSKGHKTTTTLNKLKNNRGCKLCSKSKKKTIEEAIFEFEKRGYQCLETVYVNVNTPMNFRCSKGHKHKISLSSLKNDGKCGICFSASYYKNKQKSVVNRITTSINKYIRSDSNWEGWETWEDKIDWVVVEEIAKKIQYIYDTCPQSHAVDHVIPVSVWDLTNETQLRSCWHEFNLRHLPAVDNIRKRDRVSFEDLHFMLNPERYECVLINLKNIDGLKLVDHY